MLFEPRAKTLLHIHTDSLEVTSRRSTRQPTRTEQTMRCADGFLMETLAISTALIL